MTPGNSIRRSRSLSIARRPSIRQGRIKKWRKAVSNWLNGLPMEDENLDTDSVINQDPPSSNLRKKGRYRDRIKKKLKFKRLFRNKQKERGASPKDLTHEDEEGVLRQSKENSSSFERPEIDKLIEGRPPVRIIHLPSEDFDTLQLVNKKDDLQCGSVTNGIRTAKYTIFNFLPKNILEQMRRVANVYFVVIVILQCIPAISNYNPLLAAMPIITIMAATAIKDAVEDWRRHQQDNKVNYSVALILNRPGTDRSQVRSSRWNRFIKVLSDYCYIVYSTVKYYFYLAIKKKNIVNNQGKHRRLKSHAKEKVGWKETFWYDMRVGDVVLLRNNEMIPADILILSTSEPDGVCFVETKNLDGETNLKIKRCPFETEWIQTPLDAHSFKATLEVDLPNNNLYSFNGKINLEADQKGSTYKQREEMAEATGSGVGSCADSNDHLNKPSISSAFVDTIIIPITNDGILLRGCVLRNTDFVIGVVIYTGPDTKLMLNSGGTPSKRTRIERQMNPQIILNFILLFIICLSCAIVQSQFSSQYENAPYWVAAFQQTITTSSAFLGFLTFWSSLILFQTLVPISMYITVEMIKTIQAYFINNDQKLYHAETDSRAVPRAWNLADDLGQIQFLFSDKTGTLTQNVMEFRRCSIGGQVYGSLSPESLPALSRNNSAFDLTKIGSKVSIVDEWSILEGRMIKELQRLLNYPYVPPTKFSFVDFRLFEHVRDEPLQRQQIFNFFLALMVCHTVLVDLHSNPEMENPKHSVNFRPHNLVYKAQSPDEAALVSAARDLGFVFLGRDKDLIFVSILGEIETIKVLNVLEFSSDRKRMSIIIKRQNGEIYLICKGADNVIYERLMQSSLDSDVARYTQNHLDLFAEEGLRTLCISQKKLNNEIYTDWASRYTEALSSMANRDSLVESVAGEIEHDLELLGATAIEDKLQDGVPDCIELLQKAGIKLWVLTGDKMETAINIGFSCKLLNKSMVLLVIRGTDIEETRQQLQNAYEKIWSRFFNFGDSNQINESQKSSFALIIEGSTLKYALDSSCKRLFVKLSSKCEAVICCRVSPIQKAKVVELIKKGKNAMTLAIGDGANDVSMIQAADIGVGIAGQEGMQAVMSSDYAISQFRFLSRLLLVHGRWSYIRVAEVTLCSLYKNLAFVVLLYWYQFYCGFTAQYIYDYMYLLFFNVFLSILPLLIIGSFDRDLFDSSIFRVPPIYRLGMRQTSYSMKLFLLYMIDALYQSVVCFFIPLLTYQNTIIASSGQTENQTLLGNVMALSIIICTNLYMAINTYSWVMAMYFALGLSILTLIGFLLVYSIIPGQSLYGSYYDFINPIFWMTIILSLTVALFPRIIVKYLQTTLRPTDLDIIREIEKFHVNEADLVRSLQSHGELLGDNFDWHVPAVIQDQIKEPSKVIYRSRPRRIIGIELLEDLHFRQLSTTTAIGEPVSSLSSPKARPGFLRSLALFNLRTERFESVRGFAFSQETGMADLIIRRNHASVFGNSVADPLNTCDTSSNQFMVTPTAPQAVIHRGYALQHSRGYHYATS